MIVFARTRILIVDLCGMFFVRTQYRTTVKTLVTFNSPLITGFHQGNSQYNSNQKRAPTNEQYAYGDCCYVSV